MSECQDFIGFSFAGIHLPDLGIYRVSNSDRYTLNLAPTNEDKTVDVPGTDGKYFFGNVYSENEFEIHIAFDNLSETNLMLLKKLLTVREPQPLIFDERPYVEYYVIPDKSCTLEYICFSTTVDYTVDPGLVHNHDLNKKNTQSRKYQGRVYKGEGEFKFISYEPFGYSVSRFQDYYVPKKEIYIDALDWINSVILEGSSNTWWHPAQKEGTTQVYGGWIGKANENAKNSGYMPLPFNDKLQDAPFPVWNYGDVPTNWCIYFKNNGDKSTNAKFSIDIKLIQTTEKINDEYIIGTSQFTDIPYELLGEIKIENAPCPSINNVIKVDSKTNLVTDCGQNDEVVGITDGTIHYEKFNEDTSFTETKQIYNQYLLGDFFKLPVTAITAEKNSKDKWTEVRLPGMRFDQRKFYYLRIKTTHCDPLFITYKYLYS